MSADPRVARRILIVRLSALGDVIFVLPVLSALRARYPRAGITWVVEDKAAALLLHLAAGVALGVAAAARRGRWPDRLRRLI